MDKTYLYDFKVGDTVRHFRKDEIGLGKIELFHPANFVLAESNDGQVFVSWNNGTKGFTFIKDLRPETLSKKYQPKSVGVLRR